MATTLPSLTNSTRPKSCPFGYRRDPATGDCVKTISSVDRLMAQASPESMTTIPTGAMQTSPVLRDGLLPIYGTVGTIINTILSAAVVVGAVGGIVYIIKNKPFSRRKR